MKKREKRTIAYGYCIENGILIAKQQEAPVIQRIFEMYLQDMSYQKIAEVLNQGNIVFSDTMRRWDKHKVKRILENPHYIGQDNYPQILEKKLFIQVQAKIQQKASQYCLASKRPALKIKDLLCCACCGHRLFRMGGRPRKPDVLYLHCRKCGAFVTISDKELLDEISKQVNKMQEHREESRYVMSKEAIQLANEIDRALEQPFVPEQIIHLILRAVSVRYDGCTDGLKRKKNRPREMDWKHFRQTVSRVIITSENQVQVIFK